MHLAVQVSGLGTQPATFVPQALPTLIESLEDADLRLSPLSGWCYPIIESTSHCEPGASQASRASLPTAEG